MCVACAQCCCSAQLQCKLLEKGVGTVFKGVWVVGAVSLGGWRERREKNGGGKRWTPSSFDRKSGGESLGIKQDVSHLVSWPRAV